mmetsp:Transcript_159974/g.513276  ORF Transcript_159974/g.513276 Transcript_159974/m.513276 type:complete len:268 (-) Transcript_159974:504-1307(-)
MHGRGLHPHDHLSHIDPGEEPDERLWDPLVAIHDCLNDVQLSFGNPFMCRREELFQVRLSPMELVPYKGFYSDGATRIIGYDGVANLGRPRKAGCRDSIQERPSPEVPSVKPATFVMHDPATYSHARTITQQRPSRGSHVASSVVEVEVDVRRPTCSYERVAHCGLHVRCCRFLLVRDGRVETQVQQVLYLRLAARGADDEAGPQSSRHLSDSRPYHAGRAADEHRRTPQGPRRAVAAEVADAEHPAKGRLPGHPQHTDVSRDRHCR